MSPTHRRGAPEDNARRRSWRTAWFGPICPHRSARRPGEMPLCGNRSCLWRWWRRCGIPALALVVGLTVYFAIEHGPPPCPPGWEPLGLGDCIRR